MIRTRVGEERDLEPVRMPPASAHRRLPQIHDENVSARSPERKRRLVVGVGADVVDTFSQDTSQMLDKQLLLIGAQLAEPTRNVSAAISDDATSSGSAAAPDADLSSESATVEIAGWTLADADGSVTLALPEGLDVGVHRLAMLDADGELVVLPRQVVNG